MFEASFHLVFKYNDPQTNINVHMWHDQKFPGLQNNTAMAACTKFYQHVYTKSAESFPASNKAAACVIVE
jgi:hypothetical protein